MTDRAANAPICDICGEAVTSCSLCGDTPNCLDRPHTIEAASTDRGEGSED